MMTNATTLSSGQLQLDCSAAASSVVVGPRRGPLKTPALEMPTAWLDYNGHVTEMRYLQLCGHGTEHLLGQLGIDAAYRAAHGSFFTLETHLSHVGELHAGDSVEVTTQILAADEKRLHVFHVIGRVGAEKPAAFGEQMLIHVSAATRRSGAVQGNVRARLQELTEHHAQIARPTQAGASIGIRSRPPVV